MVSEKAFSFGGYQGGLGDAEHQFVSAASQGQRIGIGWATPCDVDQLLVQLIDLLLKLEGGVGQMGPFFGLLPQIAACTIGKPQSEDAGGEIACRMVAARGQAQTVGIRNRRIAQFHLSGVATLKRQHRLGGVARDMGMREWDGEKMGLAR